MAYSASNLYNHGTGYPGNAYYTYKSDTDTRETVMTAGYFNNSDDDLNLTADDTIFVVGDQGGYTLRVDAVSSGSVATELILSRLPLQVLRQVMWIPELATELTQ